MYWGVEKEFDRKDSRDELEKIKDHPIFKIDGKTWSVEELLESIDSHPLVFRNKKMKTEDFEQQLSIVLVSEYFNYNFSSFIMFLLIIMYFA